MFQISSFEIFQKFLFLTFYSIPNLVLNAYCIAASQYLLKDLMIFLQKWNVFGIFCNLQEIESRRKFSRQFITEYHRLLLTEVECKSCLTSCRTN